MNTEEEVRAAIAAKGEQIKAIKAEKAPTMKDDLAPLISELLALKLSFKNITGQDFDPPKAEKTPKGPAQVVSEREGPSKTELNKLAKKAAKEAARAKEREEKGIVAPTGNVAASTSDSVEQDAALAHLFGDAELCRSHVMTDRNFVDIQNLEMWKGQTVWIRARLANSRAVGKGVFLIMRSMLDNVQCILWQSEAVPKAMIKYVHCSVCALLCSVWYAVCIKYLPCHYSYLGMHKASLWNQSSTLSVQLQQPAKLFNPAASKIWNSRSNRST